MQSAIGVTGDRDAREKLRILLAQVLHNFAGGHRIHTGITRMMNRHILEHFLAHGIWQADVIHAPFQGQLLQQVGMRSFAATMNAGKHNQHGGKGSVLSAHEHFHVFPVKFGNLNGDLFLTLRQLHLTGGDGASHTGHIGIQVLIVQSGYLLAHIGDGARKRFVGTGSDLNRLALAGLWLDESFPFREAGRFCGEATSNNHLLSLPWPTTTVGNRSLTWRHS